MPMWFVQYVTEQIGNSLKLNGALDLHCTQSNSLTLNWENMQMLTYKNLR